MYITKLQYLFVCLLSLSTGSTSAGGLQLPSRKSLLVSFFGGAGLGSAAFALAKWYNVPGAQTLSNAVNCVVGGALLGGCYGQWSYSKRAELHIQDIQNKHDFDNQKNTLSIAILGQQLAENKEINKKLVDEKNKLQNAMQNIGSKNEALTKANQTLQDDKNRLEADNKTLQGNNDALNAAYVAVTNNNPNELTQKSYAEKINELNKHISLKKKELKALQNTIAFLEKSNKELSAQTKRLSTLKDSAESGKKLLEQELLQKKDAVKKQAGIINALKDDLKKTIETIDVVSQQKRITSVRQMPKFKSTVLEFKFLSKEGQDIYWQVKAQQENTFFPKNFFE